MGTGNISECFKGSICKPNLLILTLDLRQLHNVTPVCVTMYRLNLVHVRAHRDKKAEGSLLTISKWKLYGMVCYIYRMWALLVAPMETMWLLSFQWPIATDVVLISHCHGL